MHAVKESFRKRFEDDDNTISDAELNERLMSAFEIYYGLVNLVHATRYHKLLVAPLQSYAFDVRKSHVVIDKNYERHCSRPSWFDSKDEKAEHSAFVRHLENLFELPRAPKRTGIRKSLNMQEYDLALGLHYSVAAHTYSHDVRDCFDLRNVVYNLAQHLLLRNTLEQGFEVSAMNTICSQLFNDKPDSFITNGVPTDFFVADRMQSISLKTGYWVTYPDRLSTFCFSRDNEHKARENQRESDKLFLSF